jgi:hypothetical protein
MIRDWRNGGSTRAWNTRRRWWQARIDLGEAIACYRCGGIIEPGQLWHLDHTIPRSAGGTDRDSHPSHALCNLKANNKPDWFAPAPLGSVDYPMGRAPRPRRRDSRELHRPREVLDRERDSEEPEVY